MAQQLPRPRDHIAVYGFPEQPIVEVGGSAVPRTKSQTNTIG
jgi:hypothetical protein